MDATPNKSGWDKRAWIVGLILGNVFGIMSAITSYPLIQHSLDTLFPTHSSITGGQAIFFIFMAGAIFVIPGNPSGIGRRNTFLWGFLPLALLYFWIEIESFFDKTTGNLIENALEGLGVIVGLWLLIPGPISLYRYSRVRAERKRLAMQALFDAQRATMSVEQPGVWPPPPTYTGENRS